MPPQAGENVSRGMQLMYKAVSASQIGCPCAREPTAAGQGTLRATKEVWRMFPHLIFLKYLGKIGYLSRD